MFKREVQEKIRVKLKQEARIDLHLENPMIHDNQALPLQHVYLVAWI